LPVFPACVGAPPLPHQVITFVSMVSGAAGIFPYQVLVSVQAPFGTTLPSVVHGFVHDFRYESRQFGLGTAETLHVQASAPATVGPVAQQWPLRVQHCLNGLWQDGPRILRVRQTLTAVTATIQEGTLSCGEGGQAFSGPLETTGPVGMVAGSDLKVCNPEACVAAGHLPTTELKSYTGTVSDDGRTVTVEWERQLFDREYDDEGNLTSCPATEAVQETFSIGRLIFGPDTPF
ncbi:MAG TPA: hypothetical protein VMR21_08070, partial [Vicinamibacteria bacterium]|nr:hypothetical protein [Vicinamibacteria bacterium]